MTEPGNKLTECGTCYAMVREDSAYDHAVWHKELREMLDKLDRNRFDYRYLSGRL